MSEWKPPSRLHEANPQSRASASASWSTDRWWWLHRHLHVPVVVWIVASVLGGAAIGAALEPDGTSAKAPTTTEVVSEPVAADGCDENGPSFADADVDGPSDVAEPVQALAANGCD